MRKRGKVDGNQGDIVKALRDIGCSVAITSSLGGGFPDLVVGRDQRNYLMEVKDGSLSASRKKLTKEERKFLNGWRGHIVIVENVEEALTVIFP